MRILVAVANALAARGAAAAVSDQIADADVVIVEKRALAAVARAEPFVAAIVGYPWVSIATLESLRRHAPGCRQIVLADDAWRPIERLARLGVAAVVPAGAPAALVAATVLITLAGGVTVFGPGCDARVDARAVAQRSRRRATPSLTARQRDVMTLMARGKPNRAIAEEGHVAVVLRALDVDNRADAGRIARRLLARERRQGTGPAQSEIAIR